MEKDWFLAIAAAESRIRQEEGNIFRFPRRFGMETKA